MPDRPAPGGEVEAPRRRALLWVGVLLAAAVLAAVLAALVLVNGETAKAAIERRLATLTGTQIGYATLTLRAWPRPEAELRDVALRIAPHTQAAAARVVLRFALLPLLTGDVRVSLVRLEQPALTVRIPAFDDAPVPADLVAAYRAAVGPATAWLAQHARGVAFEVRDGTFDLAAPGVPPLRLDALTADGEVSPDAIAVTMAAHAKQWRNARAQARLDTHSLAASLELDFEALDAASALERVLASSATRILPAASTVRLTMTTDGRGLAGAELSIAMPALGVTRNGSRLDAGASRARLRATWSVSETALIVDELRLGDLLPAASGSLRLRSGTGGTVLDATLPRLDVGRVLAEALRMVDDGSWVHALARIVKGGNALDLHLSVVGDDVSVLADPSAYVLSMGVERASIDVPALGLQFAAASGAVRIAQGVLSAGGVAATIGRSTMRDGNIVLALGAEAVLRELTATLDVDLAENLGLAARLQGASATPSIFGGIQTIAGRARGTLTLRKTNGGYRQTYDVTSLAGTMRHAAVPLPIVVDGGGLHYESGGALTLRGLAGTIGASRVERIDAVLGLGPDPVVRSATGSAVLALDELYPRVAKLPAARALRDDISTLRGMLGVNLTRLAGPLRAAERLDVAAALTPQQVRVRSPHLPATLTISAGSIRVEGPDVDFQGVHVALQDARSILSGSLRAYASPDRAFDVTITKARIGPRSLEWAEDRLDLAPGTRVRGPLGLERAHLRWPAPAPWRLEADVAASFPAGTHADVGFVWMPGRTQIRRLAVKDRDSDFVATLDWEPERANVAFRGFLSAQSVGRMLVAPPDASGVLRGDFEARLDLRDPIRSSVTGKLAGADVALPVAHGTPLVIERIALEADGDRVSVRDTVLRLGDGPVTVAGSVARVGDGFDVDADVGVDGIDAEHLFAQLHKGAAGTATGSPWEWPLRGRVGVKAGHVDVLGYRVAPFAAIVALGERKATVDVTAAQLCGLAVPFTLTATPDTLDVKGRVAAQALPVETVATCLTQGRLRASGTMDLSADFTTSGAPSALLANLRGSARLRARDGRIGGAPALAEVLKLEDVTERLAAAELDASRDGFPYTTLEVDASLAAGSVVIERSLLEGLVLNIATQGEIRLADGRLALTGVALPIVNAIARRVPLLGNLIGDPIIGVPFSVSGDMGHPQVERVGPTAVAGALVRTLQSVVSLPVQLLGGGAPAGESLPRDPP